MPNPDPPRRRRGALHLLVLGLFVLVGCDPIYCADSCRYAQDGECDDGRTGAATGLCALGTDCSDCGANPDVEVSSQLDTPPAPVTGPPPPEEFIIVPGEGEGSCVCEDKPYYCSGLRGVTSCHDIPASGAPLAVATPCTTAAMACTNSLSRVDYTCRDGDLGIGCYAAEDTTYCDEVGQCALDLGGSVPIERCVRQPSFVGHFNHPTHNYGRLAFQAAECEVWYEVGSVTTSCGACAAGCNVFLTGGPDPCAQLNAELGNPPDPPDPPPGPSPTCQTAVDMLRAQTTGTCRPIPGACCENCVDDYLDCFARSNCTNTSCQTQYQSCLQGCI